MSASVQTPDSANASPPLWRKRGSVLGVPIDSITWSVATEVICDWAKRFDSRYVCVCNVHSVVTATQDGEFAKVVRESDLATPDGTPVAWTLRFKGFADQQRINGPDLMWHLCKLAADSGIRIGLFGSSESTLQALTQALLDQFPAIEVAYCYSPPFRVLTAGEDEAIVAGVNQARIGLLFVGLGCPKQEKWMAAHRKRVQAVMLGVGAAFDYHAGNTQRAPLWMQRNGLEWLHRLLSEPRRLWRRYFFTNSVFLLKTFLGLFRGLFGRGRSD